MGRKKSGTSRLKQGFKRKAINSIYELMWGEKPKRRRKAD